MALGSEMDDTVYLIFLHNLLHLVVITDVSFYEHIVRHILYVHQVRQITCVCQFIQIDNSVLRIFVHSLSDRIEACAAATYKYYSFHD